MPSRVLIIHTAFIGDIVLTLPLVQELKKAFPQSTIDFVAIPSAAEVLDNHPVIANVIEYDKRGTDRGIGGLLRLRNSLRTERYDTIIIPHRSLRSALLGHMSKAPRTIGFSTSAGRFLFTDVVEYMPSVHEVQRNLRLLEPLGILAAGDVLPEIYPSEKDREAIDELLGGSHVDDTKLVGIAPGSVWNTKRWPAERYATLCSAIADNGLSVAIVGGPSDAHLAQAVAANSGVERIVNAAGRLSVLQSAELIRRCQVLVTNDSAPMHLAGAMRTPVVAIFGATVPAFGFSPLGDHVRIVETQDLACRPCSIHGGNKCPIGTFVCMMYIGPEEVMGAVQSLLKENKAGDEQRSTHRSSRS